MASSGRHTAGLTTALIVRYVRENGGDEAVAEMLRIAGENRPVGDLEDETSWSTYYEKIALFEAAAEVLDDPVAARHIGQTVISSKIGGPVKLLLRALGSPGQVLRNIASTSPKFSTVATMEAPEVGSNRAVVTYKLHDGFEPHQMDCDYNIGLLSQVSVLFGLPPAEVIHNQCQVHGAGRCVYRVHWAAPNRLPWSSKSRRIRVLEDQLETLAERTEALQSTSADLVSPEEVRTVLSRIAQRAATAIRAQAFLLVLNPREGAPMLIQHEGLSDGEANRLAHEVLRDPAKVDSESTLVAEVASARNGHGYLIASTPTHRFFPEERTLLNAYARHAAVALDVALALEAAHMREETANILLELARTLAEATTRDQVCDLIAEAVPKVTGMERSLVYLFDPSTTSLSVRAVNGYPAEVEPTLLSLTFSPENMPAFQGVRESFELAYFNVETVEDDDIREQMQRFGAEESFVAPIVARDQLLGMVTATRPVGAPPIRVDVNLRERMTGLTDEAALALQKVNLLEQERAAVARLREADEFKTEFLSMVSHELRTPLAAIIGMARTLTERGDDLDETVKREFLNAIVKRGDQLQRLVGDLMQSTREVELTATPLDLSEVLGWAASDAARHADRGAAISVDAPEHLRIVGDAGRLRQVFDNLITNSLKYAPGSPITIEAMRAGDDAIVSFVDEGPGMPEDKVKRAFEPFFQGDSERRDEGVGLGLYICRRIVEAHGGTMTLHSDVGAGTTVAMRLPVGGGPEP